MNLRTLVPSLLFLALGTQTLAAQTRAPWSDEVLRLFATLPVQDGGRVKPLDTYAQFQLLRENGKRKLETPAGEKLGPTAWLLDCLFFPAEARTYRTFLVRDQAVLDVVGVRVPGRKKSDRYSYDELQPGREKLFSEAARIAAIDAKQRSGLDTQLYTLALNLRDFDALLHGLDFARAVLPTAATPLLAEVFGAEQKPGLSHFLVVLPEMREALDERLDGLPAEEREAELAALEKISEEVHRAVVTSSALAVFPPARAEEAEWRMVDHAVEEAFGDAGAESAATVAAWESLEHQKDDPAAFRAALGALHGRMQELAGRRGEYARIPLEVSFYRGDYFTRALAAFLGAFLLLCASWMAPRMRALAWGTMGLSVLGTLLIVAGVTLRCVIRNRPPVLTLYDTILFITGCAAIVLLVIEWIQRQRIALALAPVLGAAGMFLAMKYELKETALAGDTIAPLVAVLDTNFWLATHVTSITLGYAAALLAAVLGNVWLIGKMLGLKRGFPLGVLPVVFPGLGTLALWLAVRREQQRADYDFYKTISRMTYGVVCFGLFFSVVGTILGGIWANYSWGRFWGWDPKENGALLICIAELFVLHARMGGYVREHGLAALAALNGMTVAFSWWHVNNLGVGLHSYGKTEGVLLALYTYYGIQLLVVIGSLLWRMGVRQGAPAAASSGT